jgi:hypothetical protein
MIDFKTLPSEELHGGIQYIFKAKNEYGASIVQHKYSYGGEEGLWELAVLDKDDNLCYTTPITDDVLGRLTEEEINNILLQIEQL